MKDSNQTEKVIKFNTVLENTTNDAWGFCIVVPNEIAEQLIEGKSRRVVCVLNDSMEFQCGLIPAKGRFVIGVNKKTRETLGLNTGSPLQVALRKDTSKYGLPVPEELEEVFRQDEEGSRLFHALTAGRQRTLLFIVGSAKNTDKRIERAIIIVEHLKAGNGKVNMKQLQESLRRPNLEVSDY